MKTLITILLPVMAMQAAAPRVRSLHPDRRHVALSYQDASRRGLPVVASLGSGRVLALADRRAAVGNTLEPAAKVSAALETSDNLLNTIVVFHADVLPGESDRILLETGVQRVEHPDLLPTHRLVRVTHEQMRSLAEWDEVSRLFPASEDLVSGSPVAGCTGPVTEVGPIANYVTTVGNGWDGPGLGAAELTFSFGALTEKVAPEALIATVEQVLAEWSRHADIRFTRSARSDASRNLNFSFGVRDHGDPYHFDGRGGVLGHTFYPAGVNPEPIAGDLHLDDDENWSIGGYTDLYSVLLHEVGHALGLGHADRSAAVMYPYYKRSVALHDEDITALRGLYSYTQGQPFSLHFEAPNSTADDSLRLEGSVTGGSGSVRVTWKSNSSTGEAEGGRSWSAGDVPLWTGTNTIEVTATDAAGNEVKQAVVVVRTAPWATPSQPRPPRGPALPPSRKPASSLPAPLPRGATVLPEPFARKESRTGHWRASQR